MMLLPAKGRWALGADAQVFAEALLAEAAGRGLRTGWLSAEAGFLSNLSVQENLRFMYEWHGAAASDFASDLQAALHDMHLQMPDWLHQRPADLLDSQLVCARILRVFLLRTELLVVHPLMLAQAGAALTDRLVEAFAHARLLLLAEPSAQWPAWPARADFPDATEASLT